MSKIYFPFHCHTTYSLLDSTTLPEEYIKRAKQLSHKAVCFTEHGNVFDWIKKKQMADKAGLKYVHGVELYMTKTLEEKIRDNYHVILLAKNYEGVLEINKLVTIATSPDHMYYRPRITFDEFLGISDNVIKISACLGGVLNKLPESDEYFNSLLDKFDYLEIQPHNVEDQIRYNKKLYSYGKKLIAGTDTHEIDKYKLECRKILMIAKDQSYGYEDNLDLSFKSYDELLEMFREQSSLPEDVIIEAIENTNILADSIENFDLDYSFKYPSNYEDADKELRDEVFKRLKNKDKETIDRVNTELAAFSKVGMSGFILSMTESADYCKDENIPVGAGRGSVTGSYVAYVLGITDIDAIELDTNFTRFVNEGRISLGDIDTDYCPRDRQKVYEYIIKKSGHMKSAYINTYQKLKTKSIIDNVGRALGKDKEELKPIKDGYDILEKKKNKIDKLKEDALISEREYEDLIAEVEKEIENYLSQYEDIFYYYKGLNGAISAVSFHPCGIISSPITLDDSIGLRYHKIGKGKDERYIIVSQNSMKCVDSLNYVKFDILSLKTLQIIKDTCDMAGIDMIKSDSIDINDKDVFMDMIKSPVGLFQMESQSSFECLRKLTPRNLRDIALLNAVVRPSCASFRDRCLDRIKNSNPTEIIDNILIDSYGYLVYQEQIIKFLEIACGFTESEADIVRRAIGKKEKALLDKWMPEIQKGYLKTSDKSEEEALKDFQQFSKVLIDASNYSFSYNHSIAYSMITYMTAYLRYYYPKEFICAYLNNAANEEDIANGTALAKSKGIEIIKPTYKLSKSNYSVSGDKIVKGLSSILYISTNTEEEINKVPDKLSFPEIVKFISEETSINSRQLNILVSVGYFSGFDTIHKQLRYLDLYAKYGGRKILKKEDIAPGTDKLIKMLISKNTFGFSESETRYKINADVLLSNMWNFIKDKELDEAERAKIQINYLKYIQDDDIDKSSIYTVLYNKSKNGTFCIKNENGNSIWVSFASEDEEPKKGDIIFVYNMSDGRKRIVYNYVMLKEA